MCIRDRDRDANALWLEAIKSIIGLGIIFSAGNWFLLDSILPFGTALVAAYQVISAVIVGWFVFKEIGWKKDGERLQEEYS